MSIDHAIQREELVRLGADWQKGELGPAPEGNWTSFHVAFGIIEKLRAALARSQVELDAAKSRADRAEAVWRRFAELELARIAWSIESKRDIRGSWEFVGREEAKRAAAKERYAAALAAVAEMGDVEFRP